MELAQRYASGAPARVHDIAAAESIPSGFLVQLLQPLKRAGIVESIRGAGGGYRLARSPQQITLADILLALDPTVGADSQHCAGQSASADVLHAVWHDLTRRQYEHLSGITLAELVARRDAQAQAMYYI